MEEVLLLTEACNKRHRIMYGEPDKKGKIDNKTARPESKKVQTMDEALADLDAMSKKYPGKLDCIVEVG